jgi:hypothetical protein
MPDTPLAMHRDEQGRVIIALASGTMKILESGGEEKHVLGRPESLPASARRAAFRSKRQGQPIEATVVEIKNDK